MHVLFVLGCIYASQDKVTFWSCLHIRGSGSCIIGNTDGFLATEMLNFIHLMSNNTIITLSMIRSSEFSSWQGELGSVSSVGAGSGWNTTLMIQGTWIKQTIVGKPYMSHLFFECPHPYVHSLTCSCIENKTSEQILIKSGFWICITW